MKIALVTGGSRGIGAAVARTFIAAGMHVATVARKGAMIQGDITRDAEKIVGKVMKRFGRLDILVNTAGAADPAAWTGDLDKITAALWDKVIGTDLKGTFLMCRAAARVMKRGKIVNVASIPALVGDREGILYSVAKGGVLALTKSLAVKLAPRIQVNCMAFGSIETGWADWLSPAMKKAYVEAIPLRRFGTPEEAAELALFLVGNDYVTGQTYVLDGGETRG